MTEELLENVDAEHEEYGVYSSRSDTVRAACETVFNNRSVDALVEAGFYYSREDAVNAAIERLLIQKEKENPEIEFTEPVLETHEHTEA